MSCALEMFSILNYWSGETGAATDLEAHIVLADAGWGIARKCARPARPFSTLGFKNDIQESISLLR